MKNTEFKQLLKEGIDSVANRQGKRVRAVEESIGEALHVSFHTVQRWKRGIVPQGLDRLEFLVDYCQQHGRVDRAWGRRFLRQSDHPAPEAVLDRLFPSSATNGADWPRIYQNLPPRYGEFIGREAEMARVLEWIEKSRWPLASIEGMGGIGKTSLAIEVGHHYLSSVQSGTETDFKVVVWTSARDYPDLDLTLNQVLDSIARVLDYTHLAQLSSAQKIDQIDQLLRRHPTLVIVDNFETVTDLTLVRFLETIPEPSKALITTRYKQLRRVWDIPLYGLRDEETFTLIRRHSHRIGLNVVTSADDDTLYRLAAATGNSPKAVELALGLIKQKGLPFNTLVDELYQASQVVEAVFDYIFAEAWRILDEESRLVLMAMPLFVSSASREALSVVSGVEDFAFSRAIERLVEMSLLTASEALDLSEQRYRIHPLTRAFARSKLGVDQGWQPLRGRDETTNSKVTAFKTNFYIFFATWSKAKIGANYWSFIALPISQRNEIYEALPNLILALDWAYETQDWPYVLILAKAIVHPFYRQARVEAYIKHSEYGLQAAQALGALDDEIWFHIDGLGYMYLHADRDRQAETCIQAGLTLAREHQYEDAVAMAEIYLAYIAMHAQNLLAAQAHVAAALDYAQGPFFKYRAYRAAGRLARHLHQYEQAVTYYQAAKRWVSRNHIDKCDTGLGFAHLHLQAYDEAERYFNKALRVFDKHGDQRLVAVAKLGLALTYEAQSVTDQSARLAQEAFEIFSQVDTPWALKETTALLARVGPYKSRTLEVF